MKSIIYKPFITQYKPPSTPEFKPEGYRPQYNWKEPASSPTSTESTSETPSQELVQEQPTTETWVNPTGTTLITDLSNPIYQTPVQSPIQRATHIFKDSSIQVGNMQELLDKFADAGISLRITSGYRPGARTSSGNQSWHSQGYALDITPGTNETWDSLRSKLRNSPELIKYMQDNGFGIIDETTPEMQARTGATGPHWHIGKDRLAISGLQTLLAKSGIKIPSFRSGHRLAKQRSRVTERLYNIAEQSRQYKQESSQPTIRSEEPLDPMSITSILPGTGDIAEGVTILSDLKNKNYIPAAISALTFFIPGNIYGGTKRLLGFNYPYVDWDFKTKSGDLVKNKGIDKEIKNVPSLLAQRYVTKKHRIPELPQKLNNEQVSDIIQNWEPQIREVITPEGKRAAKQVGWYRHDLSTNEPFDLVIGDNKLTTKELNTEFTPETHNYTISEESRRQMLDHEISHWLDETFRSDIDDSKIIFLVDGTEDLVKDPGEIIARTGQVKSYNNISDGSQVFTGEQYKQMFENYINDKHNPDNFISILKSRIKNWDEFAKWANEKVPLTTKTSRLLLWNKEEEENND